MATPNVYNQSAANFNQAGNWINQAGSAYGQAQGYNPFMAMSYGYNPAMTANPNTILSGMGKYQNPYENTVIKNTTADIGRMVNQQQSQNAATAANAGAFGGSRHGIVEALTNSEGQKNVGDFSAQLRHQGFNTAAGLSAQDIGNLMNTGQFNAGAQNAARQFGAAGQNTASLTNAAAKNAAGQFNENLALQRGAGYAGLGTQSQALGQGQFNVGQQLTQNQMGAGALGQQLNQSILDGAQSQYQNFMNAPLNMLNMSLASLGMNPLNAATTTTSQYKPGFLDYAALITQMMGSHLEGGGKIFGMGGGGTP